eukprot:10561550-Karenia_brevis.AAC.1
MLGVGQSPLDHQPRKFIAYLFDDSYCNARHKILSILGYHMHEYRVKRVVEKNLVDHIFRCRSQHRYGLLIRLVESHQHNGRARYRTLNLLYFRLASHVMACG